MPAPSTAAAAAAAADSREATGPHPLASTVEHIPVTVYASSTPASKAVAAEVAELIRAKAAKGETAVLGLATGSTPTRMYDELIRLHKQEGLSFANVVTFNLDEYYPMKPDELQSYVRFMREHLFDHIDIPRENWNVPDGTLPRDKVHEYCIAYERRIREAGGIDLQVLGIGRTGHVGFNEPGSPRDSRTRMITLDKVTRLDAASDFFGEQNVPRKAITMGVGSIMDARRVIMMAWGEGKAGVIKRAVEGDVTPQVAASFLQQHPNAKVVLDAAAAAELTRFKTPWLLGGLEDFGGRWDDATTRRATIWLAQTVKKPLLKLTDEDYNEHGLQELVASRGSAYDINIEVFKTMQATITGWPGGKPVGDGDGTDGTGRSRSYVTPGTFQHVNPEVFPKRVVVFSPHPDDDVISMGGTFIRLCDQGHEVHVAYQTSGNIAVFDEAALRHADFVREYAQAFGLGERQAHRIEDQIERFVARKQPGEVDSPELQKIKGLIRRTEARAAAKYSGVKEEHIHFLDMPFYETGRVRKSPLGEADIEIVMALLEDVKPHQLYAAGDLSDPHGTHRVCLAAILEAVKRLRDRDWMRACEVWLYRGAWQEWGVDEVEMAVPLSPDEVQRKRIAIFKHESQKDKALFPGTDQREFWERAEDRNRATAVTYDKLGLAEYEAIEGFVRWKGME
ncbi:MAG: Glucosamine-6-phosphate deaminase [uncultured Phycisphaerae bacterium]|uniref:Glucosamine-6-phosphate deaminase n=1 Tax=uncultured Phycisphaerae bacterium TaxID=904963 RepID=A0A6J4Q8D1_9BACT|nr:MAG: Glucosamine-6-phosphate deaminase [uncultured Phycisphaerae bacterium]